MCGGLRVAGDRREVSECAYESRFTSDRNSKANLERRKNGHAPVVIRQASGNPRDRDRDRRR